MPAKRTGCDFVRWYGQVSEMVPNVLVILNAN